MPKSGKVRAVPMATEVAQALAALLTDRGNPGPEEPEGLAVRPVRGGLRITIRTQTGGVRLLATHEAN